MTPLLHRGDHTPKSLVGELSTLIAEAQKVLNTLNEVLTEDENSDASDPNRK